MLEAVKPGDPRITKAERNNDALYLYSEAGMHRICAKGPSMVRITYTCRDKFSERQKPGVTFDTVYSGWNHKESEDEIVFDTGSFKIIVDRESSAYTYYGSKNELLFREDRKEPRSLEEFEAFRLADDAWVVTEKVKTADGEKEVIKEAAKVSDGKYYHTRQKFVFDLDEAVYGLGQHEEGNLNLRGRTLYLHQANRKIVIPMLVSSKGYGILFDAYSPMIFSDSEFGTYMYTESADEIDFYVLYGGADSGSVKSGRADTLSECGFTGSPGGSGCEPSKCFENLPALDRVIMLYRKLTGKASMLPRWAFGYIQSQERYENSDELVSTVEEFRKRGIGLDCIVQDWLSWPDGQWGQKSFDETRYPDPAGWLKKLHEEHAHFMISIWPNMAESSANYKEFREEEGKGEHLLLPASNVYNALSQNARKLYWKQVEKGLYRYGVDAWWCDSSEPYTPEWMHREKPEPARMYEEYCRQIAEHLPVWATDSYALFHAQSLYEGQRSAAAGYEHTGAASSAAGNGHKGAENSAGGNEHKGAAVQNEKRVLNLTRSSYTGQQRYGTVLWSGDIAASWDTLKKQIAAGLSFSASGLPYWTIDIGAFFVKQGENWYWNGEFDLAEQDPSYCELYVRWFEWACFLPVLRAHGTDLRREPWNFTAEGGIFYEALKENIDLRYSLLPHIYSLAGLAWLSDRPILRMLSFDHPDDPIARECRSQYMLGDDMMICPVTYPMYYPQKDPAGASGEKPGEDCTNACGTETGEDCANTCGAEAAEDCTNACGTETAEDCANTCGKGSDKDSAEGRRNALRVYLPAGGWCDYYTGKYYDGEKYIDIEAPLDRIPVFVKAGSIIPCMEPEKWSYEGYITDDIDKLKLRVYPGADGEYLFYDDAGDGYGYERGEYRLLNYRWNDREKMLDVKAVGGEIPEALLCDMPKVEIIDAKE